jgi:outer membrane protein assembly factor BamA
MQQSLLLGKGSGGEESGPRLRKATVYAPEGVKPRRAKRATGYRKGDDFPEGAGLDVEVDVVDWMGRKGFPAARVDVETEPVSDKRVDLHVAVHPGPYVSYEFEGEKIPRAARRDIAALYRPGEVGKDASLDRVREMTEEVLRGRGFLHPEVDVRVEAGEDGEVLRVHTEGGRRIEPGPPRIEGIPEKEAGRIADRYVSVLAVVELAAGVESADRRLLRELRDLGWSAAQIRSRELSDDGETVTVRVEPGGRQHVGAIEIAGVAGDDAERLVGSLQIAEGQPVEFGLIAVSSRAMEDDLRDRGHAEARVRTVVRPMSEDDPLELAVRFEVNPGPTYRLADVRFEGLRASKRRWVERTAKLEPGGTLRHDDVAEARQRLYQTGVFRRIDVTTSEDGDVNGTIPERSVDPVAAVDTTVSFELQEAPRFQLAYGGRWEDGKALSAVVDFTDTHSLGRGHTSGVRVIYGEEKKRLRLYHMIPRIVGNKSSLELFIEGKDDIEEIAAVEGIESWIQLTFPAGRHQMRTYAVIENREVTPLDLNVPVDDLLLSPRFGWQAVFSTFDARLDMEKRKGTFVGLDISGSFETLGSDADSVAAFSQFKWFLPFRHVTWAQSWRIGLAKAFDAKIPFVDRLRAGGEFSVRGYPTNSLGPRGQDGVPLGGEVLFVVNQELHRRLWRSLWAFAFFDAGNVWLTPSAVDSELSKAYGVGFRYSSPIGPLRLDFGWPLDRREGDPDYRIYIGFGSVF